MALRHPQRGDAKLTDAARIHAAAERCLQCLFDDLRIQAHWHTWYGQRQIDRFGEAMALWQDTPQRRRHIDAFRSAVFDPPSPDAIAELERILEAMGVWRWPAALLLGQVFPAACINSLGQRSRLRVRMTIEMQPGATAGGRLPPDEGQRIRDRVDWWYRTQIKQPPDLQQDIVQKLVEADRAAGIEYSPDRHPTVSNGIKQAIWLLERWDLSNPAPLGA